MSTRVVALSPVFENQQYIDIGTVGSRLTYSVLGYTHALVQVIQPSGTWGTGVVAAQLSLDGNQWSAFPTTAVTITSAGTQQLYNVMGAAYLRLVVTTANGSSVPISLLVNGVDTNG